VEGELIFRGRHEALFPEVRRQALDLYSGTCPALSRWGILKNIFVQEVLQQGRAEANGVLFVCWLAVSRESEFGL